MHENRRPTPEQQRQQVRQRVEDDRKRDEAARDRERRERELAAKRAAELHDAILEALSAVTEAARAYAASLKPEPPSSPTTITTPSSRPSSATPTKKK